MMRNLVVFSVAWNSLVGGADSWITNGVCRGGKSSNTNYRCSASSSSSQLLSGGVVASAAEAVMPHQESSSSSSSSIVATTPAATGSTARTTQVLADHDDFVTPERDPRKYRAIKLANNLQVLLVCDEMTTGIGVEAASVHVQAGHFDDTIPGLARKFLLLVVLLLLLLLLMPFVAKRRG